MSFLRKSVLIGVCAWLTGCAASYHVKTLPQAPVASAKLTHGVNVSVAPEHGQFDDIRLQLSFTNRGDKPVYVASEQVSANLDGLQTQALSYESQLFDIEQRLAYYSIPISYQFMPNAKATHVYWQSNDNQVRAVKVLDFDDYSIIHRAQSDLKRLREFGFKPQWVQPGGSVSGEVVLPNRVPSGNRFPLSVRVNVGGEAYGFEFEYSKQ